MSDDQFTKLFNYIQQIDIKFEHKFDELKSDIHRVYNLVDKQAKHQETERQEG